LLRCPEEAKMFSAALEVQCGLVARLKRQSWKVVEEAKMVLEGLERQRKTAEERLEKQR
jgi:hypothetical protein